MPPRSGRGTAFIWYRMDRPPDSTTASRRVCGIDEAGLGPLLGPLVVTLVTFRCRGAADLGSALPAARTGGGPARLRIDDSKAVFRGGRGFPALEAAALAALSLASGGMPRDGGELLRCLDLAPEPGAGEPPPWYPLKTLRLPLGSDPDDLARRIEILHGELDGAGVTVEGVRPRVATERSLNGAFARGESKASVLLGHVGALVLAGAACGGSREIRVDRLGGRKDYAAPLATWFPAAPAVAVEESGRRSDYAISDERGRVRISFTVEGEAAFAEIALASMVSKYVREVFMEAFNRFFAEKRPGIRPTRGYVTDGRRFLRDLAGPPALRDIGTELARRR